MSATLSPGLWFCAPQIMVRSLLPSLTLQTESFSELRTLSRVRICATTIPSNSPASLCAPSTSRPSRVSRSASSPGDQSKSTYCLSQLSVTFIGNKNDSPGSDATRDKIVDRRAAARKSGVIILAQQSGDGRGDLALCVRPGLGAFAERRCVRPDDRD